MSKFIQPKYGDATYYVDKKVFASVCVCMCVPVCVNMQT
jgi:hypothetical protein